MKSDAILFSPAIQSQTKRAKCDQLLHFQSEVTNCAQITCVFQSVILCLQCIKRFATLQIALGTDIYTVSKMLTHRSVKTTQIYADLVNSKKRESANRISLK